MALLNEKQIAELLKMASITSTATSYHDDLCEWNEKQTTQQIEIDWNDAPKHATKAALRLYWVTSELWTDPFDLVTFDRPTPVITPHPHAEIMAKYAEVAARRVDPWVEFEYKYKTNKNWLSSLASLNFNVDYEYRHIGDEK